MLKAFFPTEEVSSTYLIDFEGLYRRGIRGIIFDIDNTLVPHGAPADERANALFKRLKDIGFECCLLSNNKQPRLEMFNRDIGVHGIWKAGKPKKYGYMQAMKEMHTTVKSTVFIGDQLFTDVWGANRCGIPTILVGQIDKKEEIQIVLKRYLERVVLFFYHRKKEKRA